MTRWAKPCHDRTAFAEVRRATRRQLARSGYSPRLGRPPLPGVEREPSGKVSRAFRGHQSIPFSPDSIFRKMLRGATAIQLAIVEMPPAPQFFRAARTGKLTFQEFITLLSWHTATRLPWCWPALFDVAAEVVALSAIDVDLAMDFARKKLDAEMVARLDSAVDDPDPDVAALRPALTALRAAWNPRPQ